MVGEAISNTRQGDSSDSQTPQSGLKIGTTLFLVFDVLRIAIVLKFSTFHCNSDFIFALSLAASDILLRQRCAKILVGDPHQQIYAFRGARNALQEVESTHTFYLTQVSGNHSNF